MRPLAAASGPVVPDDHAGSGGRFLGSFAAAVTLAVMFVALTLPYLDTLSPDPDEAWLMLDARAIARGLRPFADFAHHEMPLHLYLLAGAGKLFGHTVFGYRMVPLLSLAASGIALFCLARPSVGALPALVAEGVFLLSSAQMQALTAVPETPTVLFTLLGALALFGGRGRRSVAASGFCFVLALMTKPTALVMVLAAAASLVAARDWRRIGWLAASGTIAALAGLAWANHVSDGVFAEILQFQVTRVGTRSVGMWSIDSAFVDMMRSAGIEKPWQFALSSFRTFFHTNAEWLPIATFGLSLLALPIWVLGGVRARPALRAFAVLWPASYFLLDFVALDFASPRYFIPFPAFSAFLLAGLVWQATRHLPSRAVAAGGALLCFALGAHFAGILDRERDLWYWGRSAWIAGEHPTVVSFTPMLFAASQTEPGCELANPALTYGGYGEAFLVMDRLRRFRFSDERIIACLRAQPRTPIVIDWMFYFFTKPDGPLRAYLAEEGSGQRLFFSPEAVEQWDRPVLRMSPFR